MTSSQALLMEILEEQIQMVEDDHANAQEGIDYHGRRLDGYTRERDLLDDKLAMLQGLLKGARDD